MASYQGPGRVLIPGHGDRGSVGGGQLFPTGPSGPLLPLSERSGDKLCRWSARRCSGGSHMRGRGQEALAGPE